MNRARTERLARLETRFAAFRARSEAVPFVWCEVTPSDRPVVRVVSMVPWPLRQARAWDRAEGEDEPAFLARVDADARSGEILVPLREGEEW